LIARPARPDTLCRMPRFENGSQKLFGNNRDALLTAWQDVLGLGLPNLADLPSYFRNPSGFGEGVHTAWLAEGLEATGFQGACDALADDLTNNLSHSDARWIDVRAWIEQTVNQYWQCVVRIEELESRISDAAGNNAGAIAAMDAEIRRLIPWASHGGSK